MLDHSLLARIAVTGTVLLSAAACAGASDQPRESPETVVRAVVDARTTGDCQGYGEHFVGKPDMRCGDPQPVVAPGPEVRAADVDGSSARVEVVDRYDCRAWDEEPVEYVDVYRLVLDSGAWRIDDVELSETTSDDCFA